MKSAHMSRMAQDETTVNRRAVMLAGAAMAVGVVARSTTPASLPSPLQPPVVPPVRLAMATMPVHPGPVHPGKERQAFSTVDPRLLRKALAALDRHSRFIKAHDRMAIVDFSAPSSGARMHLLDIVDGKATQLLVAHGSGSDPHHTGFAERFSNAFGSNASSEGAFLAEDYYVDKHGRSQRLVGLDPTNSNAFDRAVVVHGAWYAEESMIKAHGKLGRSQGCFAVGDKVLPDVFNFLGKGRMIFAGRA